MSQIPLEQARPGDVVAYETRSAFGRVIGVGEAIHRSDRPYRKYHHMALVSDGAGVPSRVIQAARRVDEVPVMDPTGGGGYAVFRCPDGVDRARAVAQARLLLRDEYGVVDIASISFNLLTPRLVDFHRPNTWICSALVVYSLHAGGWTATWPDIYQVTPAEAVAALV